MSLSQEKYGFNDVKEENRSIILSKNNSLLKKNSSTYYVFD